MLKLHFFPGNEHPFNRDRWHSVLEIRCDECLAEDGFLMQDFTRVSLKYAIDGLINKGWRIDLDERTYCNKCVPKCVAFMKSVGMFFVKIKIQC